MRRRTYGYFLTMGSALASIGLYILLAGTLPFYGYQVHGYSSIPPVLCPATALQLEADVEFNPPRYARLGDYRLSTYWTKPGGGRTEVETFAGTFENSRPGRRTVLSPIIRTAPAEPGVWRLVSITTYRGEVLGLGGRGHQTEYTTPEPVLETLSADNPRCLPPEE